MIVRHAQAGDLEDVIRVASGTTGAPHWSREVYAGLLASTPATTVSRTAPMAVLRCCLVLEQGESVCGFGVVSVLKVSPPEAELESIVIATEVQRRGLGTRLLEALIGWSSAQGAGVLRLEVRASNTGAIRLYQRHDFRWEGTRRSYYRDPVEDAVLLTRPLSTDGSKR